MDARNRTSFCETPVERVRDFWDRRPCNIRHSPNRVGTKEYFDEVEARKYFVEPHIPAFAQFARWADKRVLEIGCGIGTDTISLARHGAIVTAVDLSEKSVDVARQRAKVCGVEDRIHFYVANAEELARYVPPEPHDLVYSFGVIHHTPHPARVLDQMRHFAAVGTTLKIMVYHRYAWKVFAILMSEGKLQFWRLDELVARNSEAQTGCPVTYIYSRRQARKLVEDHGFRVMEFRVEHIFPYRVRDYVQYRYVKEPYFRWMPQPLFHWLERRMGWHLCITAEAV